MSPAFTLVVAALVGYRLARLLAADSLLDGTRDRLKGWAFDDVKVLGEVEHAYRWVTVGGTQSRVLTVLRGKTVDLLTCGYCAGFWLSMVVWFVISGADPGTATARDWGSAVAAAGLQSLVWSAVEQ